LQIGFGMLLSMRSLMCISMGMLCLTAIGQKPPAPASVGIVFDTSGSMGSKLQVSRQVAAEFLKAASARDEYFLVEFNDRAVLTKALTTDTYGLQDHLAFTQSKGRSALWDAVSLALNEIRKANNPRKALLVISDGADNSSHDTEDQVRRLAHEEGVPIYAFGVTDAWRGRTVEELDGPKRLEQIAAQSGGHYFAVEKLNDIPAYAEQVTSELHLTAPPR
jgi:VWFA-related protein